MKNVSRQKSGSALLLTLLVVSLLMVIVLSFTVYVRMQLRIVSNRIELVQARHNAKLAMNLALAQLQKAAGVDQRLTARAEIFGSSVTGGNKFWTGVWDATNLSAAPEWLVSGNNPNPKNSVGSNAFPLFPATNTESEILVEKVDIINKGDLTGEYAYWVSDEGVKASVTARRGQIELLESASFNPERHLWEYQVDLGTDLLPFFPSVDIDLDDTTLPAILQRMTTLRDFAFIDDSSNAKFTSNPDNLHNLSHDLTELSLGVLENPLVGGLKTNLSDPTFIDSFLATTETHNFLAEKTTDLAVESGLPSTTDENYPYFSPRPLLTEVVLYMGVYHIPTSDKKIRIRYHVEAEITNPYSIPLIFPEESSDRSFVIVFENMPTITIKDTTAGSTVPTITEDLNDISNYTGSNPPDSRRYINSWFQVLPLTGGGAPTINAGEIYQVKEPNPATQPQGLARTLGSSAWNPPPLDNAQISIKMTHPADGITIKMVPFTDRDADHINIDPILVLEGLKFDDFEIIKGYKTGANPFYRATSGSYLQQDYIIAYHFRIKSDVTDPQSMKDVVTSVELRDPDFKATDAYVDIDGINKIKEDILEPVDTDPSVIVQDDTNLFNPLDQLMDPTPRDHSLDYQPALLYDVPVKSPLSVGQLSSLHIYKQVPRMIGSPWGSIYNQAFDQYFLSPKIAHPTDTTTVLLNPAQRRFTEPYQANRDDDIAYHDDAELEVVVGQFNLNSTSVDAWESVLAAPILRPAGLDEVDSAGTAISGEISGAGNFFRLPQYQAGIDDFYVTKTEMKKPENLFAQGIRSLNGSTGRTQLREMATHIVDAIKTKGEPFPNMESFVNSGILQDAIDASPAINADLMLYANTYLTQNDLLTKIAPTASLRSDTFKIRAYGNTNNLKGGSYAVCEAVVHRLPQKLNGDNALTPATTMLDARDYEILSFRWLTNEELQTP